MEFVKRPARRDRDGLPVVFVAEDAVREDEAIVQADALGELAPCAPKMIAAGPAKRASEPA